MNSLPLPERLERLESPDRLRHRPAPVLAVLLALALCTLLSACGTTRPPQPADALLKRREDYKQAYLDQTNERYTALVKRNKDQLDEYRAGKRPSPPVIDFLIVSGGGDIGAFGAGFLK